MPTKKIADLPRERTCTSSDHNPPSMRVFEPGVYEHVCSACGKVTRFTVNPIRCWEEFPSKRREPRLLNLWGPFRRYNDLRVVR